MKQTIDLEMNHSTRAYDRSTAAAGLKAYVRRVFSYMGISLGLTAVASYLVFRTGFYTNLFTLTPQGARISALGHAIMWAPLVLVLAMDFIQQFRGSKGMLYAIAAIEGVWMSLMVMFAGVGTAFQAFLIAGGMFGAMAVWGYTTDKDLTSLGSILLMGVLGLFITSIVGLFTGGLGIWFSYAAVIVFTLLIAWQTQTIKSIYHNVHDERELDILAVQCALSLYLSFINIFVHLLRILGNNRN
jgi:FtsH-binding integral membrane protein